MGAGRVGSALACMAGERDTVVRRGEAIPGDSTGPILVCTRNDALDSVVDQTPESRREGEGAECRGMHFKIALPLNQGPPCKALVASHKGKGPLLAPLLPLFCGYVPFP